MFCDDKPIFHSMHASRDEFGACGTYAIPHAVAPGCRMNWDSSFFFLLWVAGSPVFIICLN